MTDIIHFVGTINHGSTERIALCGAAFTSAYADRGKYVTKVSGIGACTCSDCIVKYRAAAKVEAALYEEQRKCRACGAKMESRDFHAVTEFDLKQVCLNCRNNGEHKKEG